MGNSHSHSYMFTGMKVTLAMGKIEDHDAILTCKLENFGTFWKTKMTILHTPPKFNSSPLKNSGWKTILSYLGFGNFSGAIVVKLRGVFFFERSTVNKPKP